MLHIFALGCSFFSSAYSGSGSLPTDAQPPSDVQPDQLPSQGTTITLGADGRTTAALEIAGPRGSRLSLPAQTAFLLATGEAPTATCALAREETSVVALAAGSSGLSGLVLPRDRVSSRGAALARDLTEGPIATKKPAKATGIDEWFPLGEFAPTSDTSHEAAVSTTDTYGISPADAPQETPPGFGVQFTFTTSESARKQDLPSCPIRGACPARTEQRFKPDRPALPS